MKMIKYISVCLILFSAFMSCTKDDEMVTYNPENAVSGKLNAIGSSYVLEQENEDKVFEEFIWSASDFGFSAAVEYILEADLAGEEFKNPVEVFAIRKALANEVTVGAMNKTMTTLQNIYEFEEGEEQNIEFRLRSSISEAAVPVYSNVIASAITPYSGTPTSMYMIGQDFGEWNWSNSRVVEMVPVNDQEGQFWCVRYITAANGFKWSPEKDWGKDFNALTTNTGFEPRDGNAFVDADGMYMVFMDYKKSTLVIEPAKIYGIGGAFDGWDDPVAFTINKEKASIVVTDNSELRMYTTCSAAPNQDWWRWEFIILDGKIVYRGNGGDQERVSVTAGQTVTLDFNTETGTIQ
ncbi:MAG: SusF/SusE family outer membrane protein [Tannerellaceae bacterium]|nr:SusF/SusE family outer membrane protein [Tannerellaceae bacterium]